MGLGGISIWQLLIILVIVVVIFGARKLRNVGSDVGGAVKGFKDAMKDGEADQQRSETPAELGDGGTTSESAEQPERDREGG